MHAKPNTPAGQDLIVANLISVSKGAKLDDTRREKLVKMGLIRRGAHRDFLTPKGRDYLDNFYENQ
jgi:ribosomal protein S19E (S16A)